VRGRFNREIALPVPDASARRQILGLLTSRMRLGQDVDLEELGRVTPGYVGADLDVLAREAGAAAVRRVVAEGALQDGSIVLPPPAIVDIEEVEQDALVERGT